MLLRRVQKDMARTVHRFHAKISPFNIGEEDVFLIIFHVPRAMPELDIENLGSHHFLVAIALIQPTDIGDQLVVDKGALRMKERTARRKRMKAEQVQFFPQATMVTTLGLF